MIEDLNVAELVRNRKLARLISDAGFGEFRRQLTSKTQWYGSRLVVADRWFPSSKTCSGCKAVKPKLSLAQRTFTCGHCGLVIDRDLNASINLRDLVAHVAGSGSETRNGRGADQKTRPGLAGGAIPRTRKEPSIPHPMRAGIRQEPSPRDGRIPQIH